LNFKGHLRGSIIAGLAVSSLAATQGLSVLVGSYAFLGGLFPDLDIHSTPSKWAARFGVAGSLLLLLADNPYPAALIGLLFMLAKTDKHRGWTHSILLPPLLALAGYKLGYFHESLAFGFGCYVHLFSDSKMIKKFSK
jgi:membrane-bound metal-dependent hydrolase YbcI (DUF457 family)